MRLVLRLIALGGLVVVTALWFFGGANLGWTKTSVPVRYVEEVTELESVRWESRFLPGVDFLGAGIAVAGLVLGASFLFAKK